MNHFEFSETEKAEKFDEIAKKYYDRNFGQTTKAEIDLLMFKFYYDKLLECSKKADGSIDYLKCSDYEISKELGITQQRVRNWKVKKQLVFPQEINWEDELAKLTTHARYDSETKKITIGIPDPNLFLEIQNYIEGQGGYIETQLNSKILQIRAEYFLALALCAENEKSKEEIVREIKKKIQKDNKEQAVFDEKNIGKSLLKAGLSTASIVNEISSLFSPGNILIQALCSLLEQFTK